MKPKMNTSLFPVLSRRLGPAWQNRRKRESGFFWPFSQDSARASLVLGYYHLAHSGRQMEPLGHRFHEMDRKIWPSQAAAPNRRPRFTFVALLIFDHDCCAQPSLSAAVGELRR